jgi:holo-[acyl-carrier protein] synthase
MISGIGTDIVAVVRLRRLYERYGERVLEKILAPAEWPYFRHSKDSALFLAKRFAAKEAFAKALGTGLTAPATLTNIIVEHDPLGRPIFEYAPELAKILLKRGLVAHLSISDETDFAVAFVILEHP